MKIFIGSDHGGYELKKKIISYIKKEIKTLRGDKVTVIDEGTDSKDSTDYPIYAKKVCKKVLKNNDPNKNSRKDSRKNSPKDSPKISIKNKDSVKNSLKNSLGNPVENSLGYSARNSVGIVICGTGIGISIAANKFTGIRAANCTNVKMARLSREHNDANVLALGGRLLKDDLAKRIVKTFLLTEFSNEKRHQRRIKEIEKFEKE